jgi:two-component system, OmpR family, phosphate regulon response regulator PhoB
MVAASDNKQVFILDRDIAATEGLRQTLTNEGFSVSTMSDSTGALSAVYERTPDLVLIDWNMPGATGVELLQAVRRARAVKPVRLIILSALAAEQDVVRGLSLGADDYIVKPFSMREVLARIHAVMRPRASEQETSRLSCDQLVLDVATKRVTAAGRPVCLRAVQYRLLEFLMSNPGRAFNRAQLLAQVWGSDSIVDERTVDVNIQRLRKILDEPGYGAYLQTVRGFGYSFGVPVSK